MTEKCFTRFKCRFPNGIIFQKSCQNFQKFQLESKNLVNEQFMTPIVEGTLNKFEIANSDNFIGSMPA